MEENMAIVFVAFTGIVFLAINTVMSSALSINHYYWSIEGLWGMASIIHAFSFIMLLFLYLQLFDRAEDSRIKERLKIVIWPITTLIGITSVARASMILSLAVTWWVWVLVGSISFSSFYFFFIKEDQIRGRNHSDLGEEASPVEA